MATQWNYQSNGATGGSVAFGELVDMVRAGQLEPDDLVRPDYRTEWQRADTVAGLFYMARRPRSAGQARGARPARTGHSVERRSAALPRWLAVSSLRPRLGRIICIFVPAIAAAVTLDRWSAREMLRFPGFVDDGARLFPLLGECRLPLYGILMLDVMFIAGVAAYWLFNWVERNLTSA